MYYEKLALEVNAAASGLNVVKPASLKGKSGIDQKFTFVATDDDTAYAFDIYPEVNDKEVLRTYIKELDTGAEAFIVSLQGKASLEAVELARGFGIELLGPGSVGDFFNRRITEQLRTLARAPA